MTKVIFSGIEAVSVQNYKSIVSQTIDLRPITLLAGANSSGKSSMMQPLLLLKQTLENTQQQSAIFLPGDNVNLTTFEQIRSKVSKSPEQLMIGVKADCFRVNSIFTPKDNFLVLNESEFDFECRKLKFKLYLGMSDAEVKDVMGQCCDKFDWVAFPGDVSFKLTQDRCFFCITSYRSQNTQNAQFQMSPYRPVSPIDTDILGLIHLPGLRGDPREREQIRYQIPRYPDEKTPGYFFAGTFPAYTASVIEAWRTENNGRYATLTKYMRDLRLTNKVSTRVINDSCLEIVVGWDSDENPNEKDMVGIADVGVGVSQVLPILVALIAAKEGQVVYIEQPAIHLHPLALIALAKIIIENAKRNVRIVIETHSALLLLALQTVIAEQTERGELQADFVALYWFTKNKSGITQIQKGTLDENGAYGDWPEDFSAITMKLQMDYMNAIRGRLDSRTED